MSLQHQLPEEQPPPQYQHDPTAGVQNAPEQTVQSQSAEEAEALLASLKQEVQRRRRYSRIWMTAFVGWALLVVCAYLFRDLAGREGSFPAWVNFIHLINLAGIAVDRFTFRNSVAAKLAQLEEVACVGALVEVLGQKGRYAYNASTRVLVADALTRLLPRLKASDAALLTEEQRAVLRNVLKHQGKYGLGDRYKADFLVAILQAFEQIGDTRCVPYVAELARFAEVERVREAAAACLPYLQEAAEQERNNQTLLRAASAGEVSPDLLLRPACAVTDTNPDQLLRATATSQEA